MRRQLVQGVAVLMVVGALMSSERSAAQVGGVIEPSGHDGAIDWTKGVVTATGIGAP